MAIRFNEPFMTGNEITYLTEVCQGGQFGGNGPFTKRVERLLEERFGVAHVLLTHSCTAALEMAALLLDLGPGDEVILPSYTFVTTASAFLRTGVRLVFCEVDPGTMNIDVADVAQRITPRTRAIVPVHYAGRGADVPGLLALAQPRGIHIVEDAAQGLGAALGGRPLGTLAPLGALSFHETKNLHCGLGGALFINDSSLFDRAEDVWERGTDRGKMYKGLIDKYSWVELGSSFYPSELQAAFLLAQLEALDRNAAERTALAERYEVGLRPLHDKGLIRLPSTMPQQQTNHHAVFFTLPSGAEADRVRHTLVAQGVQATIHYLPLHSSKMGLKMGYRPEDLPITEAYAPRLLRMPLHLRMTLGDVDTVVETLSAAL